MEEVVQTLVEEGALSGEQGRYHLETTPTELQISPTVQGVLAARIDRLAGEEKALLQQLSVIGRQFPVSLVKHVVPQSEAELHRILASLQAKEFLYEQPAFPESEYIFKHALTQDVAYGTVLQEQRKVLHEQTGHALETLYQDHLEEQYSELAYHYRQSGNTEKAVEYLGLAGHQAVQRSANAEAVEHFSVAIELLQTLPDTPERRQHELGLQVALGVPLIAIKGFAASAVGTVYQRAQELCEQVGSTSELFSTLFGLWIFHLVRADYKQARELGEQLLRVAHSQQDPALLLMVRMMLGHNLLHQGELVQGRTHLEHGNTLYDTEQHHALAFKYGSYDPGVASLCIGGEALWLLGYPEQAMQKTLEALTLARDLSHPFSIAFALELVTWLHQFHREGYAAQERAEAVMALSTEHGFQYWLTEGSIFQGWALAEQGHGAAGLRQISEGLAARQAMGAGYARSYFLGLLAEAYGKDGQADEGLRVVDEALAVVKRTEEHFYEAELHRLKGELALEKLKVQSSKPVLSGVEGFKGEEEAEVCFRQAIDIARQQKAKSWELRAATSLARLWQGQGKVAEARELLTPVYGWFTEGFDTADLKDAKALLNELETA